MDKHSHCEITKCNVPLLQHVNDYREISADLDSNFFKSCYCDAVKCDEMNYLIKLLKIQIISVIMNHIIINYI